MALLKLIKIYYIKKCEVLFLKNSPCFIRYIKVWFQLNIQSRYQKLFYKYLLLMMLLQLSQIFSLCSPPPSTPHSLWQFPPLSSCQWVMYVSSLASPFPILFLRSHCLFQLYTNLYLLIQFVQGFLALYVYFLHQIREVFFH